MSTSIATRAADPVDASVDVLQTTRVAIDVLMSFHSITTTDSVEHISGGLA